MTATDARYYVPHDTRWPIVGSVGLFLLLVGFANYLLGSSGGGWTMGLGALVVVVMMVGWFGRVIDESQHGLYSEQVDRSFRQGMAWFIFSEVMFFAAFFGALFYARNYSVAWLAGEGAGGYLTHPLLWSGYDGSWPTNGPRQLGGPFETVPAFGIPALNTLILLSSGATVTLAHWALKRDRRLATCLWLLATVVLGVVFLVFQVREFTHAWGELNLTLGSGIYGSTFYMLTGFHGLHVTIGAIMLAVMLVRAARGHFTADNHFAFEAAAWYWHFVDVVWLGLFTFVYWF